MKKPEPDLVTYDGVPLTEGQIMMLEDGCPRELLVPADVRRQYWKGVRARPIGQMTFAKPKTKDEDPATTALRKEVEAADRKKQAERLQRLKELRMTKTPGPKEQQVKGLRETRVAPPKKTKPAAAQPQPETPAPTVKETTVKTARKAAKPAAKKAPTKKAPASSRRKAPSRASAARPAPQPKETGVRPGSKLEIIVGLLRRPEGCTTKQALEACNWSAISFNQQAAAAGIKLKKEKVDGVTVYRAS